MSIAYADIVSPLASVRHIAAAIWRAYSQRSGPGVFVEQPMQLENADAEVADPPARVLGLSNAGELLTVAVIPPMSKGSRRPH
jgi:hypothetical protein